MVSECCVTGFTWDGTPTGRVGKLGSNDTYITGDNPDKAIMIVHDLFGWTFPNLRLLADHYAQEAGATVYLPDFFGGEVVAPEPIIEERFAELDLPAFLTRNSREAREPELFACARALRARGYRRVGAAGFCYGGWACLRLAAAEHDPPLVDAISIGHPSLTTEADLDGVSPQVPVQILAPEIDAAFPDDMKVYAFKALQRRGVAFDYQHFPGAVHACFVRGDERKAGERAAMIRGKNAAVNWFREHLE
ncbi:putative hydrolase [Pestalotiopsis sp. NC0098]|nr:putative hydrolase [Pestalotiopsis sp. NC0098]